MSVQNKNMLGAMLVILATLSLTLKDSADKYLILHGFHPVQMVFFRFTIPFLCMLIFMPKQTKTAILATNGKLLIRSALFLVCAITSVISLKYIPLEVYIIIVQMGSVAYMLGGAIFFKETLTAVKIIATLLGFAGVVIVMNPTDVGGLHLIYLLPLVIVVANTGYNLLTKTIDSSVSFISIFINSFFILGSVSTILLIAQPDMWITPTMESIPYFITIPVVTIVSQLCLIKAMKIADASHVAPFFYFQILFACIFGYWLFDELPTIFTLGGGVFIVAAGIIITYANYKPNRNKSKQVQ
ncbi:DMT family transporter [Vibrio sp. S11_S32]|uniref:DMT family transporter n=1 Tax=Vibrio sp. S11_S32 TaxID=2720225 RepID=UPI001680D115|nr:DMT family transporter [Vibrio sp. S11_S32]MBD1575559.1 DMT family transporter [Vibrio sp. S11_S32]